MLRRSPFGVNWSLGGGGHIVIRLGTGVPHTRGYIARNLARSILAMEARPSTQLANVLSTPNGRLSDGCVDGFLVRRLHRESDSGASILSRTIMHWYVIPPCKAPPAPSLGLPGHLRWAMEDKVFRAGLVVES